MTEKELKKNLKKLGIVVIVVLIGIVILFCYTMDSKKSELSIYDNTEYAGNVQVFGMDEEELKQYLSMFGNLVSDEKDENVQVLDSATFFIDNMYSAYDVEVNENGLKNYDADLVNSIAEEINGTYIKESIEAGENYTYRKDSNTYTKNKTEEKVPYCTEIVDISKNEDKMEITFKLAFLTNEQLAEYASNPNMELETQNVKIVMMNNEDYEYSKYFVSSIEKV